MNTKVIYRGRFAPSPTGDLHLGSLTTALGSYLEAKANNGSWLLRIEDLDYFRIQPASIANILHTLELYGLEWDEEVLYQSKRIDIYREYINDIIGANKAYYCSCNRKRIKELGGIYDGYCKEKKRSPENASIRFLKHEVNSFSDRLKGIIFFSKDLAQENFIIQRKDGLPSYNLAVVVDDIYQGITEVVRGSDLENMTSHQIALYNYFELRAIKYVHLPVINNKNGFKLSKQHKAKSIPLDNIQYNLLKALKLLGLPTQKEMIYNSPQEILTWSIANWSLAKIPKVNINVSDTN